MWVPLLSGNRKKNTLVPGYSSKRLIMIQSMDVSRQESLEEKKLCKPYLFLHVSPVGIFACLTSLELLTYNSDDISSFVVELLIRALFSVLVVFCCPLACSMCMLAYLLSFVWSMPKQLPSIDKENKVMPRQVTLPGLWLSNFLFAQTYRNCRYPVYAGTFVITGVIF